MSINEFVEICKRLDWKVDEDVYNAWAYFDIDEHAARWYEAGKNGRSGVPSLSTLVWDAEQISKMLEQLYYATIR